jgi:hypothetical protein
VNVAICLAYHDILKSFLDSYRGIHPEEFIFFLLFNEKGEGSAGGERREKKL